MTDLIQSTLSALARFYRERLAPVPIVEKLLALIVLTIIVVIIILVPSLFQQDISLEDVDVEGFSYDVKEGEMLLSDYKFDYSIDARGRIEVQERNPLVVPEAGRPIRGQTRALPRVRFDRSGNTKPLSYEVKHKGLQFRGREFGGITPPPAKEYGNYTVHFIGADKDPLSAGEYTTYFDYTVSGFEEDILARREVILEVFPGIPLALGGFRATFLLPPGSSPQDYDVEAYVGSWKAKPPFLERRLSAEYLQFQFAAGNDGRALGTILVMEVRETIPPQTRILLALAGKGMLQANPPNESE